MPRRAALAQVLGVSPWRRGGRPVPLGTDAGRAATAARCSRTTSGERAPEERPAGRPAIIYILSAWRARVLACSARLHASRVCAFRVPACSARLHASRWCASGAPARTFTWRASRASHLAHSVRTDATHCVRPDASCCVRSVYKVGQFRAQSQVISRIYIYIRDCASLPACWPSPEDVAAGAGHDLLGIRFSDRYHDHVSIRVGANDFF